MKILIKTMTVIAASCVALAGVSAQAANFTIHNTGVDSAGNVLADNASDGNYTLISAPAGISATPVVTNSAGYPTPPWLIPSVTSKWIQPNPANYAVGNYTYRTTFDLTGFDHTTASLMGQWAVDNTGLDILINGVSTGNVNNAGFSTYTPFSISSGFISGLNTLDFKLNNSGGPTGLRVDALVGTANVNNAAAVPEPGSMALIATGLLPLLGFKRRRS